MRDHLHSSWGTRTMVQAKRISQRMSQCRQSLEHQVIWVRGRCFLIAVGPLEWCVQSGRTTWSGQSLQIYTKQWSSMMTRRWLATGMWNSVDRWCGTQWRRGYIGGAGNHKNTTRHAGRWWPVCVMVHYESKVHCHEWLKLMYPRRCSFDPLLLRHGSALRSIPRAITVH